MTWLRYRIAYFAFWLFIRAMPETQTKRDMIDGIFLRIRKWLRFGHAPAGPCLKCPYPHLPHNHARNEQGRSGFY